MLATQNDIAAQQQLLERLFEARRRTDELFSVVKNQSIYERPIPERHRIIFYIGHLEAFDWNLLGERVFGLQSFHPKFDRLFAFGIDPVGGGLPNDQPSDWPALERVEEYAARIREVLDESIGEGEVTGSEFPMSMLLNVVIEHRLMHAETLAYMIHRLPVDKKVRPPLSMAHAPVGLSVEPDMIEIPAGSVTLGLSRDGRAFGWDNEFEAHRVSVPAFAIDQYKVTNQRYLDFINAGGYGNRSLWEESDWDWKVSANVCRPVYWKHEGSEWRYRGMFEEIPLPSDAPVYVSLAEARAYARWAGKDLPTEGEWQRATYGAPDGSERAYPWGSAPPSSKFGNFDFSNWDPTGVNEFPEGRSAFGVADLLGNGWEWTSTPFGPFAGFEPFPFYRGYSADFFDGKHFVMKGGSARTAACMLRPSFRNWFQPHYQYVYAGFRCVRRPQEDS